MFRLPERTGQSIKSPARLRLERELADVDLPESIRVRGVDWEMLTVDIELMPDEGPFSGASITFHLIIPASYPHAPPKARIMHKLFHPNFDYEGHVCLNILRLDWNPVLGLTAVLFGLLSILLAPEADEPLNQDAGRLLEESPDKYCSVAQHCARGGVYEGVQFDKIM